MRRKSLHLEILSYRSSGGGAARAANRINESINSSSRNGLSSSLRVIFGPRSDLSVSVGYPNASTFERTLRGARLKAKTLSRATLRLAAGNQVRSTATVETGIWKDLNQSPSDLVILNWIGDYTESLEALSRISKPFILRNADMWWFSDTRHFPDESVKEKEWLKSLNRETITRKQELIHPNCIASISPSEWMAEKVRGSNSLSHAQHHVISTPINHLFWRPLSQKSSREKLGIPIRAISIGFGADRSINDSRKGWDVLESAVTHLAESRPDMRSRLRLDIFGGTSKVKSVAGIPVYYHGLMNDHELRQFYSAVDVFALTSKAEGFPNTAVEAFSCGARLVIPGNKIFEVFPDGSPGIFRSDRGAGSLTYSQNLEQAIDESSLALHEQADLAKELFGHEQFNSKLERLISEVL